MSGLFDHLLALRAFASAYAAQRRVLRDFHARAARVLDGACALRPHERADLSIERNAFSTLFLAVLRCAGLPAERLPFYGLANQCMRAWVTGCDNLLDDEYKAVLPFDLPEGGHRFQSVLTLMTADRVFADALRDEVAAGRLSRDEADALSAQSLRVLTPSGLQEHEEELGAAVILRPDEVVDRVHVPKTGLLFEAPLALPERLGHVDPARSARARAALRALGLACQAFDDINDLDGDLAEARHNLVVSIAVHGDNGRFPANPPRDTVDLAALPVADATLEACRRSLARFDEARVGLASLGLAISPGHWARLVNALAARIAVPPPAADFIRTSLAARAELRRPRAVGAQGAPLG